MDVTFLKIPTNGIHLHAAIAGPEEGPLLLFLHGFPESWRAWERHLPFFAEAGYRVVAPDQRGYNLSDKPSDLESYVMNVLVQDVLGLIEALGRRQAVIIGHDWGAAVAWEVAERHPDRVDKLVVMDVPHASVMKAHLLRNPKQMLSSWYMAFFQLPRVPELLLRARGHAVLCRVLTATSRPGTFSEGQIASYREAWSQPGALTSMLNWYRSIRVGILPPGAQVNDGTLVDERDQAEASERVTKKKEDPAQPRIQTPTLILWGKLDSAVRYEMAFDSAKLCAHPQLEIFEHATHWLHHEEPVRVQKTVLKFLVR